MQKILDKEDVMEKKNLMLQPIFRDLKSCIKHMTYTEEYKILKEFFDMRMQLEKKYVRIILYYSNNSIVFRQSGLQG